MSKHAFPTKKVERIIDTLHTTYYPGMSYREWVAGMCFSAILSSGPITLKSVSLSQAVKVSIEAADALIAQLGGGDSNAKEEEKKEEGPRVLKT